MFVISGQAVPKPACKGTDTSYKIEIWITASVYHTVIDFNEVDMRIYLPEKVIFTEVARVDKSSCLPKLKPITVLFFYFHLLLKSCLT